MLQIYDGWNTSVPSYVFGGQQEMPVFQSKSYFLTVVFKSGGTKYGDVEEDNIGFSAIYTYVSCEYRRTLPRFLLPASYKTCTPLIPPNARQ